MEATLQIRTFEYSFAVTPGSRTVKDKQALPVLQEKKMKAETDTIFIVFRGVKERPWKSYTVH